MKQAGVSGERDVSFETKVSARGFQMEKAVPRSRTRDWRVRRLSACSGDGGLQPAARRGSRRPFLGRFDFTWLRGVLPERLHEADPSGWRLSSPASMPVSLAAKIVTDNSLTTERRTLMLSEISEVSVISGK